MGKNLFIAEKPSVAREFAKALKYGFANRDGYMESQEAIVTWCVGHLVTMSYPEVYDENLKKWSLTTLPFIPTEYKYEVIDGVKKQFQIVSGLLNREDVTTIYVCTDAGREGEYIYRLVEQQAQVTGKVRKRVWIDSQTEEEILRGIREAKDLSCYDALSDAAYLRAKEDYLMGINFSRVLTLKYSYPVKTFLGRDKAVISVGRVMTCVLGIVVNREREIRGFVKTPFYRVLQNLQLSGHSFDAEWRSVEGSKYFQSPLLYKENGFLKRESAEELIAYMGPGKPVVDSVTRKKETKNPPLLYNLAELQNDCSKFFKISPDETLRVVQELYEKKLTTYPRTDARVLSSAVAKEIHKNLGGLKNIPALQGLVEEIFASGSYKGIGKTRYTNDKQITDHYAIIPTGQGLQNLSSLNRVSANVYEVICRRFLSIFMAPAVYQKISLITELQGEKCFAGFKVLEEPGYLKCLEYSFKKRGGEQDASGAVKNPEKDAEDKNGEEEEIQDSGLIELVKQLKKGMPLDINGMSIKEGETSPPKRYNSGTLILTMENAGQFIEDEELRAQIKGSGIGTSATRAEILKKLVNNGYLALNKKTQIVTPTLLGEMIYEVVTISIKPLLDPRLTASWEKGLTQVAGGEITEQEYLDKLNDFVKRRTNMVKTNREEYGLSNRFRYVAQFYKK